jgi:hypothetical protein
VFIGHGVVFINDLYPTAVNEQGRLQTETDWSVVETRGRGDQGCGRLRNRRRCTCPSNWRYTHTVGPNRLPSASYARCESKHLGDAESPNLPQAGAFT